MRAKVVGKEETEGRRENGRWHHYVAIVVIIILLQV